MVTFLKSLPYVYGPQFTCSREVNHFSKTVNKLSEVDTTNPKILIIMIIHSLTPRMNIFVDLRNRMTKDRAIVSTKIIEVLNSCSINRIKLLNSYSIKRTKQQIVIFVVKKR